MARLQLLTHAECCLAIGPYPRFQYDARGGGGFSQTAQVDGSGRCNLNFSPADLRIPPLDTVTTRILGLPLPPGLRIEIQPEQLNGWFEQSSGRFELYFEARFQCSVGRLYKPAPLKVKSVLSTAAIGTEPHPRWGNLVGQPLNGTGAGVLVGVAAVPASGDPWIDRFLGLPGEALAVLRCSLVRR